ncbi:LppP/LprE family lipoprotein [Corynebacterium tuberculostearicum]|uniref:LppP/LprE family lipoprotein n=1 Tax=Corynebacterium tuberculostearicum TaxID=38304 RepID=UPI00266671CB|nr:LppP/LprE family lipoprotein [Corynebacterium tuberculostearicum]
MQWTKDTVTVTWRAYADDDPACCATQEFTGNLTLDGDTPHLEVTGHRQVAG